MKPSGFYLCMYKRKGQPIIPVFIQNEEAEICMSLEDFKIELIREIGSVRWIFSEKEFSAQINRAFAEVIRNVKSGATSLI